MTSPETLELEAVDAALAGRYVAPEHAELAELALLLRDDRPEPTPAWATHLDRRVEAGFPARPRERKFWVWLRNVAPALGLAACVVLLVIGAATISPGGGDDDEGGGARLRRPRGQEAPPSDDVGRRRGGAGLEPDVRTATRAAGDPGSDRRRDRDQRRSASLTLAAPRREIDARGHAGRRRGAPTSAASSPVSTHLQPAGRRRSSCACPATGSTPRSSGCRGSAACASCSRQSVDITANVVSARERLTDARAERKSLLGQLANAVTVNETESIRARLEIVSREIAAARRSLRARQQRGQLRQRRRSRSCRARAATTTGGAWTPGDAFDDALRVLEVVAGVARDRGRRAAARSRWSWLLAWLGTARRQRRRRERALDMA